MRGNSISIVVVLLTLWLVAAPALEAGSQWKLSELKVNNDGTGSMTLKTDGKYGGKVTLRLQLTDAGGKQLLMVDLDPVLDVDDLKTATEAWTFNESQIQFKSKRISGAMSGNNRPAKAKATLFMDKKALTDTTEVKISATK